jgi:hypothetical protein
MEPSLDSRRATVWPQGLSAGPMQELEPAASCQ